MWSTVKWYKGILLCFSDFPGGSDGKASAYNVGDPGSIPPGERNSNPLQYSCLENPMDGGAAISFPTLLVF